MFVFTGSQQFTMIKDLGDSLAGRIGLLELLPFCVSEKQQHMKLSSSLKAFTHAALTGSYPELVVDRTADVYSWYGSYISTPVKRRAPRIYYLRTGNNLEIDLLIEGRPAQTLLPVEIKLSKTPSPRMGANIIRFKKLFPQLNVSNGIVLSLTEKNIPLSREITALTLGEYIQSLNRSLGR